MAPAVSNMEGESLWTWTIKVIVVLSQGREPIILSESRCPDLPLVPERMNAFCYKTAACTCSKSVVRFSKQPNLRQHQSLEILRNWGKENPDACVLWSTKESLIIRCLPIRFSVQVHRAGSGACGTKSGNPIDSLGWKLRKWFTTQTTRL